MNTLKLFYAIKRLMHHSNCQGAYEEIANRAPGNVQNAAEKAAHHKQEAENLLNEIEQALLQRKH